MLEDKIKWNERYIQQSFLNTPSDLLVSYVDKLKIGKVLDIASGEGRNSKFLASYGFICDCVDISEVALKNLADIENINPVLADLDDYKIKQNYYDVILDFYFLDRRLFSQIKQGLKQGGVFIMETYIFDSTLKNEISPQRMLEENELEREFKDFEILHKTQKILDSKNAKIMSFVARKILKN